MRRILLLLLISCCVGICMSQQRDTVYAPSGRHYSAISEFQANGLAQVMIYHGDAYSIRTYWTLGYINRAGKEVIPPIYLHAELIEGTNYILIESKAREWGVANLEGKICVPLIYNNLPYHGINKNNCSHIPVRKKKKFGCIDLNGNVTIPFKYDFIDSFRGNRAAARKDQKYGVIDRDNNVIVPFQYSRTYVYDDGITFRINDKVGLMDINGKIVITPQYDKIILLKEDLAEVELNGKWGFINKHGDIVVPIRYDYVGLHDLSTYIHWFKRKGISLNGTGYTFRLINVKLNDKWGAIDKKGNVVIPIIYDSPELLIGWERDFRLNGRTHYFDLFGNEYETPEKRADAFDRVLEEQGTPEDYFIHALIQHKIYENGDGENKYLNTAIEWYTKSAAQGNKDAQEALKRLNGYVVNPTPAPTKNLASLTWMNFKSNTQQKDYSFKICVESQSKIEDVKVYINGVIERGIAPVLDDGCDMTIARNITLVEGDNVLKVVVKNAAGEAQVERTVTYAKQRTENTITPPSPTNTRPKRIALVMGNASYQYANSLVNPVHDADGIASKLRQLGFTVILANNKTHEQMDQAIDEFSIKAKGYDVALFYYAGHGVQVDGENYLIPVDANLKDKTAAKYRCVNMNEVLERMEESQCPLKIVILDACRNNPFRGWRMTGEDGFSSMSAPTGTCIFYSTSPRKTASDGPGMNNSPYTAAIIKLLDTPGLKLSDFFDRVRTEVIKTTNNQQHPWISGSYDNDFYFNPQK